MNAPDFKLHCRQCGGAFWEMIEKLNHRCQKPTDRTVRRKPAKSRKKGIR